MLTLLPALALAAVVALYVPVCAPQVRPAAPPPDGPAASLWQRPDDLADRDVFNGPWGADLAPRPDVSYTLTRVKHGGVNPGLSVRDPWGRKWSIKQAAPDGLGDEGPVEVTLSRILSAVGYHQPPVYFLPAFSLTDDWGTHTAPGGRFRLSDKSLRELGSWSWQQNPFVGTRPYQGLLVILLMFNSTDLKNGNNSLYLHRSGDRLRTWYVVRDLGSALGTTGRMAPYKNNLRQFEQSRFIVGVTDGFVDFAYDGWHQELVRHRLTPDDVRWAADLLSGLSERQWHDAFRAGGYARPTAERFIAKILANIAHARRIGTDPHLSRDRW